MKNIKEQINEANRKEAEKDGRYLPVVASVIGTELDTQNLDAREEKLKEVGVIVLPSNARAMRMAAFGL